MNTITITDTITGQTIVTDRDNIEAALFAMNPYPTGDVVEWITDLAGEIRSNPHPNIDSLSTALGVEVSW